MKNLSKTVGNEINTILNKHTIHQNNVKRIQYWEQPKTNPQYYLNGYPQALVQCLTRPQFREKEQCVLISEERLTHPANIIQTINHNLSEIITNLIILIIHLQQEQNKLNHHLTIFKRKKLEILKKIIQNLEKLAKQTITKKKKIIGNS